MEQQPSGPLPQGQAELSVCVFPHLTELLVIDARQESPEGPRLFQVDSGQVLNEQFYQEMEAEFRELLRQPNQLLSHLTTIPQELDAILKHKSLKAIVAVVTDNAAALLPDQVAIVFCSGPILSAPTSQLAEVFQHLTGNRVGPGVISEWTERFEKLQVRERLEVKQEEEKHRRGAIQPTDGEFYTLWEKPRSPQG